MVVVLLKVVRWRVGRGGKRGQRRGSVRYGAAQGSARVDTEQTTWLATQLVTGQRRRMQVCHLVFLKMGTRLAGGQDLHSTDLQAAAPPSLALRLAVLGKKKNVCHPVGWTWTMNGIRHGHGPSDVSICINPALSVGRT